MITGGDFWDFVDANLGSDPNKLRLKYHGDNRLGFDVSLAITQIECRKRFGKKLAETLATHPHWLFPTVLSGEQATSDRLATYHASLISEGERVADLTAGLGIDVLHFSTKTRQVTALDIEAVKAEALAYNLASTSVKVVCDDCRTYVERSDDGSFDTIFIDPARRAADGARVFALSDCQPNVVEMLPALRRVARRMIVKMSPMLDIAQVAKSMPGVKRIISLGTETECKELIAIVDLTNPDHTPTIEAMTLLNDGSTVSLTYTAESEHAYKEKAQIASINEGDYVYDPYPAVMKAGAFNTLQALYGLKKPHHNTQLFYKDSYNVGTTPDASSTHTLIASPAQSSQCIDVFPGTVMRVEKLIPYNSKYIKRLKNEYSRINVATRNFDISADALRKKLGVADGGDLRLVGITLADNTRAMLILKKVK